MATLMTKNKYLFLPLMLISIQASAVEVGKAVWITQMESVVPVAFCQSEQYFRQCFDVTAVQCEETMSSSTRVCLTKHEKGIPDPLNQPEDGTHWGTVLGTCVGETYEATLAQKRKSDPICFNPSHWQQ